MVKHHASTDDAPVPQRTRAPDTLDFSDEVMTVLVDIHEDNDRERLARRALEAGERINTRFIGLNRDVFFGNVVTACQLGALLYLDERTVLQYCFYWLGEYQNGELAPSLWFADLIDGLLSNLPALEITGQFGLKYTNHLSCHTRNILLLFYRFENASFWCPVCSSC
jgi:hypothetical protein